MNTVLYHSITIAQYLKGTCGKDYCTVEPFLIMYFIIMLLGRELAPPLKESGKCRKKAMTFIRILPSTVELVIFLCM